MTLRQADAESLRMFGDDMPPGVIGCGLVCHC